MARNNFEVGDIIRYAADYCKITKIENLPGGRQKYWGRWENSLTRAQNNPSAFRSGDSYYDSDRTFFLIKKSSSLELNSMKQLKQLSRREQIIFIANRYKEDILKRGFLNRNADYNHIADDLGISAGDLYKYFTFKLRINKLAHRLNEWKFVVMTSNLSKDKKEKTREEVFEKEAVFSVSDVWKLLAYYCKYYSVKEAKCALSRFERLFAKKDWDRIKEMWTPMFYPDYDYLQSKMIVCKILNSRNNKPMVYDAELLDDGMTNNSNKRQYLNKKCIVIAEGKDKERIDYLLQQGSVVKIVGRKEKPFRNKTSEILKITTIRRR